MMTAFEHVTALFSFVYALALTHLLARIAELIALFLKENLTILPMFIPTLTALVSRKRWVQWAAGLCYLAMVFGYTIAFCGTLS